MHGDSTACRRTSSQLWLTRHDRGRLRILRGRRRCSPAPFIDNVYNAKRMHSSIGYQSANAYEAQPALQAVEAI